MSEQAAGTKPEKDRTALIALAVIVVLITMAALAAWLMAQRYVSQANESNAIAALREIAAAQPLYHRNDWDNDRTLEYALPFTLLYTQKDASGNEVRYIPADLARATRPGQAFRGYYFVDITADGSTGSYVGGGSQPNEFGVCAVPARYPTSGRRTFLIDTTGVVYGRDNGGKAVTTFPASPRAAGWVVVE